ncbi:iron ABC transporter permease [Microbacterium sp. cx-59]|uniref:FecCD family ABC transporter permease n=1 Tax=Microbacterium sp. cx-59 TaxID=2891207 RepID=UPI001E35E31C|nr:iron ABC transporter permease [Microbacterium sp. cx-59]MCC4907710.1 iron ABC transporter permease [Microbacterium sp. cx-59]
MRAFRRPRFAPPVLVLAVGVVALVGAVAASVALGSRMLGPGDLAAVLAGAGTDEFTTIVSDLRVPRTLAALLGGASLAVAGAVMQGHTRNRLADPGLLGVTGGSAVAVVIAISLLGIRSPLGYVWFAIGGAAAGVLLVATIAASASLRRDSSPATLVLAGAAVSALLGAATGIMLLLDSSALERYRFWTVGSLAAVRGYETVIIAIPLVAVGLCVALFQARALDVLSFGDDIAASLGRSLGRTRALGVTSVTLLVAGAVACCGSLTFVGLIAPNALRLVVGPAHRILLPASALYGATLTLLADIAGRFLVYPGELPVGIVLSIIGGPLFVLLVAKSLAGRAAWS